MYGTEYRDDIDLSEYVQYQNGKEETGAVKQYQNGWGGKSDGDEIMFALNFLIKLLINFEDYLGL